MFAMKTLLLLTVLFSAVLFVTAEVDEVKPKLEKPKEEVVEEKPVDPEAAKSKLYAVKEMDPSPEVRFFNCPTGWDRYRSGCYQYVRSPRSWASAVSYCTSLGASLPSVRDLFEYSFLQDLTRRAGYTTSWTGGFYFQGWRWLDESSYSYQNWGTVNSATSYPCIYLNANAAWTNGNCGSSFGFICVMKSC